ncbi:twin-arginine translocase subunit TatC [Corynebacterium caspium]|uniref:twin-arginine translocase subunit TatC n=1 Tax=Corynebacterium caspium TaxID=234828 RepID=UPI000364BA07
MSSSSTEDASGPAKSKLTQARRRFYRRSKRNPEAMMTIIDHLKELRRRVITSAIVLVIGMLIGFLWYQNSILGIPTLGEILRKPYCELPPAMRVSFNAGEECRLLATGPFEMLLLRMKVGALAGAVLTSPLWLYQIWAFIVPGLHKKEKHVTRVFLTIAVTLFVAGAVLSYFVLSYGLEFLVTIGDETQQAALTGDRYFGFMLGLLIVFGISFEVPLIIGTLNVLGLLQYAVLKEKRSYIIVGVFIFAAAITPGQDPFSMVALAISLSILVEISLQFCRINDKRRNRERPAWLDLADDASSSLNPAAEMDLADDSKSAVNFAAPNAIPKPAPVKASGDIQASRAADLSTRTDFDDIL